MNRNRAKVSRQAKKVAAKLSAKAESQMLALEEEHCQCCEHWQCQSCDVLRRHDEAVEQEFYCFIEKYSPRVQERAGKLCGFKAFGSLAPHS